MAVGDAWTCLVGSASWPGIASTCVGADNFTHPPGSISTFRNSANKDTNLDEEFNCGENCNVHFVPFDIKSSFWAGGEEICGKFFSLSKIEGVDDHFFYAPVSVKSF